MTASSEPQPGRSYGQGCPVAIALDLLGDRWTLLILRDLAHAPLRYLDLQAINPGLSTNLLAIRLRQLEAAGLVVHKALPAPASGKVYALEMSARPQVLDILNALGRFGASVIEHADGPGDAATMLRQMHCNARWLEAKNPGLTGDFNVEANGSTVGLRLSPDGVSVSAEPILTPSATLRVDAGTMARFANGGLSLAEAESEGLTILGDREAGLRLLELLSLH